MFSIISCGLNFLRDILVIQSDAQCHLAERYAGGRGIALDPVQAWKWYQLADEGDHPTAAAARSKLVKVQGMTLDQILAARELVSQFKPRKK